MCDHALVYILSRTVQQFRQLKKSTSGSKSIVNQMNGERVIKRSSTQCPVKKTHGPSGTHNLVARVCFIFLIPIITSRGLSHEAS